MTSRVHHFHKKTGTTYVYESISYWDKKKKQPRNRQVCIGKLDPLSGAFVPSRRLKPEQAAVRDPAVTARAEVIGPSMILDVLTDRLRLTGRLKESFPNCYKELQTMAYYLTIQGGALSHCETWCKSHAPEMASLLSSQRISEILSEIGIDGKQTFCALWMKQVAEDDYLCYDLTSVSSYAQFNEYIRYGYNRDGEDLPQVNLAMLFGQKSGLPVYFQHLPGNITDVTTLCNLLKTVKALETKKLQYVMDRGFYSQRNIQRLLEERHKFIIGVPNHLQWIQLIIDDIHEKVHSPQHYHLIDQEVVYVHSRIHSFRSSKRRCYLHLYYNPKARAATIDRFYEKLIRYKQELETGVLNARHQEAYEKYFIIKTTPKRGTQVSYNDESVHRYVSRYAGFQAIFTDSVKDPIIALQVYRDKDAVEKCFDDLKNQLDMNRLRMHSAQSVQGRLFVQFLALIYMSALRKEMRTSSLTQDYSVRELLQEMTPLTKINYVGKYGSIITEVTKPQRDILTALNIPLPNQT